MKKLVALLLALTLCIGLCACGATAEKPAEETPATTGETETPATDAKDIKVGFIFLHD